MKRIPYRLFSLSFVAAFALSCSTPVRQDTVSVQQRQPSEYPVQNAAMLPEIVSDRGEMLKAIHAKLKRYRKVLKLTEAETNDVAEKIRHYLFFLGLTAKEFKATGNQTESATPEDVVAANPSASTEDVEAPSEDDRTPSNLKAIMRLFNASTQFLHCGDFMDWVCLEQTPKMTPLAKYRIPLAPTPDLGAPVRAGEKLDMEVFFTQAWDQNIRSGVVDRFAERIYRDSGRSLSIAMYGIDDADGTMKPVYDAIIDRSRDSSAQVRAVVDVFGFEKGPSPWVFDYVPRENVGDRWLFAKGNNSPMHVTFQYSATPGLISALNQGITSPEQARVRLEWPASNIMHNKYAVLENSEGNKSVWTGTANISNHCMGAETNSNMAVYIKNDTISQAFLDQFDLMYGFDPKVKIRSKLVTSSTPGTPFPVGRFHRNKYPVSQRYFTFDDGTEARVHFAPTDDAEHRVILPMLLSAREGDEIRISMFGGTGYEIVRAMQYAVARGANIKIVFDRQLGAGQTSWIRDSVLNVFMKNPYIGRVRVNGRRPRAGKIQVRVSTWNGKNHYKAGTLTRRQADGSMFAEQIIVGSQNWSSGGNDSNDENLLSVRNLSQEVESARLFNEEFDQRLWTRSRDERPRAAVLAQ